MSEDRPYREALVAAAKGHIALLRQRHTMLSEGGVQLKASVKRYDDAHTANRQAAVGAQDIRTEAETRLGSLERE